MKNDRNLVNVTELDNGKVLFILFLISETLFNIHFYGGIPDSLSIVRDIL